MIFYIREFFALSLLIPCVSACAIYDKSNEADEIDVGQDQSLNVQIFDLLVPEKCRYDTNAYLNFDIRDELPETDRTLFIACAIQDSEAFASTSPQNAEFWHMVWLLEGVHSFDRNPSTIRRLAPHFTREKIDLALSLHAYEFGNPSSYQMDVFGCGLYDDFQRELYELGQPDRFSRICSVLQESDVHPTDEQTLSQLLPYDGHCILEYSRGLETWPMRLAASVQCDEVAYQCLLQQAMLGLDNNSLLVAEQVVPLYIGYRRGDVSEKIWNNIVTTIPLETIDRTMRMAQDDYWRLLPNE